jgi:hypothetical protein
VRLAVHQLGQAGIGLHAEQAGPVLAEPADMLGHLLRPEAQFSPISGTSSECTTAAAAAMSGPTSSVPVVSTVTCTKIGRSDLALRRAALAAFTAALM